MMYNGIELTHPPCIASALEQDFYKYSMGNVIFKYFNEYKTKWEFKCRPLKNGVLPRFTPEMIAEIRKQIDYFCTLRYTEDELTWLKKFAPWLSEGYIDHLRRWYPRREQIKANEGNIQAYNDCGLAIEASGTWLDTSMYEIPILAIVNEVYFAFNGNKTEDEIAFQKRTIAKFDKVFSEAEFERLKEGDPTGNYYAANSYAAKHPYHLGTFSEFGMRRRYSREMQDWLVKYIVAQKIPGFVGTSNVYLAKKYGVKAVGTMAHELIMTIGQATHKHNPAYSNYYALRIWRNAYGVKNGIALTDTITTDAFLRDFSDEFAATFSGVRHDSGDPIEWGEKMIAHYQKLGIDPNTKTLLFSDSLDFERATKIRDHFLGRAQVAFGIGTFLSNPLDNPLNIVMKVTEGNGSPVAKISDSPGKSMCRNDRYVEYLKRTIEWRLAHEKA